MPTSVDVEIDVDLYHYIYKAISLLDMYRNQDRADNIQNFQPRYRGELQLVHDAFCIGIIAKFREKLVSEGKKPIGPWFLTFDSLITFLNETKFRQDNDYGYVIQPRTLLNWLLIFSKIQFEEDDKKSVAEAIIKFTARSREETITIIEYSRLITYKLGLEEKDIKLMEEIFLASPLRTELERALDFDHAEEADLIASKIVSNEKFVETVVEERRSREKFKMVAAKLREKEEELSQERTARKVLEGFQKQNISITTNFSATINVNIQTEVSGLISLLETENAFSSGQLEKPSDISTTEKLLKWLERTKGTIETSKTINEGTKTLLPFIMHLLMKLQG